MYLDSTSDTCLLGCPDGSYPNNEEAVCEPCVAPCLLCYNMYLCISCQTGIFYNKVCVSECPEGTIHDTAANTCALCTANCLTCSTLTSNCTGCPNNYYLLAHSCVSTCPDGLYPDPYTKACEDCITPC